MSLTDLLIDPGMRPFEIAFAIVLGLLLIEVVLNLLGLSALGATESDADVDLDLDAADIDVADIDLDGPEATADFLAGLEIDADTPDMTPDEMLPTAEGGVLSWLGVGKVPFTIWLAGFLTGFAIAGYGIQFGVSQFFGTTLRAISASALALPVGLWFAGVSARTIARLVPKTQTTAIKRRSYHRRRGVITVGTARRGHPAQARFQDGHGNAHYTMVEPLDSNDALPQGTEILILRVKDSTPRAVALSALPNAD